MIIVVVFGYTLVPHHALLKLGLDAYFHKLGSARAMAPVLLGAHRRSCCDTKSTLAFKAS
jgi:hypothetical protein